MGAEMGPTTTKCAGSPAAVTGVRWSGCSNKASCKGSCTKGYVASPSAPTSTCVAGAWSAPTGGCVQGGTPSPGTHPLLTPPYPAPTPG